MLLYHPKILLTIPFYLQYDPLSVSAKFCFLLTGLYFSPVLFQALWFLRPLKGLRIRLRPFDLQFYYNI